MGKLLDAQFFHRRRLGRSQGNLSSNVNEVVLTCGSRNEANLSMIDLRTPVAASRKSSSSETNTLPKVEKKNGKHP